MLRSFHCGPATAGTSDPDPVLPVYFVLGFGLIRRTRVQALTARAYSRLMPGVAPCDAFDPNPLC